MARQMQVTAQDKMSAPLHVVTPMVKSVPLSQWLPGCDVYLKMESSQVSGSFKMRGIAYRCQKAVQRGSTHLVGASGGNAGLALACAARLLNVPCTVYVPVTTPQITVNRLKSEGANVVVHGTNFSIANERALQEAEKPGVSFVHAYNHPEIWEGHASIMDEAAAQLPSKPSVIVLSVGGGGLMSGVLQGLHNVGWADVPVVAMETYGAHCFNMSVNAKRVEPLDSITRWREDSRGAGMRCSSGGCLPRSTFSSGTRGTSRLEVRTGPGCRVWRKCCLSSIVTAMGREARRLVPWPTQLQE
ncbi:L-serine dehydratase/L-threonine deaminase isoform X4 [Anabrus simplex]|uniref:L-serine dehydratase/L-threonine deaminase isoform X4 n=1 Tax=Anabrus simplex TaxID=316456 RepID=UPI0035A31E6C